MKPLVSKNKASNKLILKESRGGGEVRGDILISDREANFRSAYVYLREDNSFFNEPSASGVGLRIGWG